MYGEFLEIVTGIKIKEWRILGTQGLKLNHGLLSKFTSLRKMCFHAIYLRNSQLPELECVPKHDDSVGEYATMLVGFSSP